MQLDALLAMGIYTAITVAFYLLGAAVLHGQGLVPEGGQMIATLSRTFTGIFGPWGYFVFLTGPWSPSTPPCLPRWRPTPSWDWTA